MRNNRKTFTRTAAARMLAALSAVLLAVCEFPEAGTVPEESEAPGVIRGPEGGFRMNIDPATRWTVAADGAEGGENGYYCTDPNKDKGEDCAKKCPEPKPGWGTYCSCTRSERDEKKFWCTWEEIAPGEDIEGGSGGCGRRGDTIDGGEPARCRAAEPIRISLHCSPLVPKRGQEVRCQGRPTNSDYDTEDTYYNWTAECFPWGEERYGNQCAAAHQGKGRGSDHKTWSGRITMTSDIVIRVSLQVNDSTWVGGSESEQLQVTPRTGWGSADGLLGTAKLNTKSLDPKGGPWKRGGWGRYVYITHTFPSYSTKSGSGPWAGTKYLSKMPKIKKGDWMYAHPDLYDHGPDYPGAFGVCGGGRPSADEASLHTLNGACGEGALLAGFRSTVEAHERKHKSSTNKCVRSEKMRKHIRKLEAAAGWDIEWVAGDAVYELTLSLAKATETNQSGGRTPEGMWHYRIDGKWADHSVPADPHSGTDGC